MAVPHRTRPSRPMDKCVQSTSFPLGRDSKPVGVSNARYVRGCRRSSLRANAELRNPEWYLDSILQSASIHSDGNRRFLATPACLKEALRTSQNPEAWERCRLTRFHDAVVG